MSAAVKKGNEEFSLKWVHIMNWLLLAGMICASFLFGSITFAKGVLVGGLLANLSYILLKRDLESLFLGPLGWVKFRFFIKYYARLTLLGVMLYVLIRFGRIDVFGLLTGLSTVVVSIVITALGAARRLFFTAKEAA